jgi:poly(3-hydroxybutyrate) depolymerase
MSKIKAITIFSILLISSVVSQEVDFEIHLFDNGSGTALPYRLLKPQNPQPDKKYPLLLFFHGAGTWGSDNIRQLSDFPSNFIDSLNRAKYPCYCLVPQCTESEPWTSFPRYPMVYNPPYPTRPIAQVLALIDSLRNSKSMFIDTNRIYVTGLSLGGEATFDIVTRAPHLFACAVPLCGIADTAKADLLKDTPLWIFHGSLDNTTNVEYARMIVAAMEKIGAHPKYTEYEGYDHSIWGTAYNEPDLLPWIFSHNKSLTSSSKNHYEGTSKSSEYSVKKKDNILIISWKSSVLPDAAALYSLDGKFLMNLEIKAPVNQTCTLLLTKKVVSKCIISILSRDKILYTELK